MVLRSFVVSAASLVLVAGLGAARAQLESLPQPPVRNAAVETLNPPAASSTEPLARYEGRFTFSTGYVGMTLELRRDGRFELLEGGCTAESRFAGRVELDETELTLRCETETDIRNDKPTVASDRVFGPFVPVTWGERLYLVDRQRADEFCDAVNAGDEPRFQSWNHMTRILLRDQDWMKDANGQPDVPADWMAKLLPEPVAVRITSIEPDGRAVVDLGRADGILPGMHLTYHFADATDWAVPKGQPWSYSLLFVVEDVGEHTCSRNVRDWKSPPHVGQLVTGRIPTSIPLPLKLWRAAGDDPRLSFDPLLPLPGTTQSDFDQWTTQIRSTLSPGVPIRADMPTAVIDALTPAFFNALRGLDMSDAADVGRAAAILDVWKGYQSQCGNERAIRLDFEGDDFVAWQLAAENHIWQIETFVMWWREMSADPKRFAEYQRAQRP